DPADRDKRRSPPLYRVGPPRERPFPNPRAQAGTVIVNPTARVSENLDVGITNGGEITVSLVFLAAQCGMKRTEDKIKRPQCVGIHIPLADGIEIHLDGMQDGEALIARAQLAINSVDLS